MLPNLKMPTPALSPIDSPQPCAVIDTQVVMDWLVFRDARVQPLAAALQNRQLRWLGTSRMQEELLHVLGRGIAAAWEPDLNAVDAAFAQYCERIDNAAPAPSRLACRDTDDQMFIDLALACRCDWLISRDRAVLALARRARTHGTAIVTPEAWVRCWQALGRGA